MSLYQRQILRSHTGWRFGFADSSKVKGTIFFAVREDRFLYSKALTLQEIASLDLQTYYESRSLVASTFGVGTAGELNKTTNYSFSGMCECGDTAALRQWRWEHRGFCSDKLPRWV
jgi:hypothetical protein